MQARQQRNKWAESGRGRDALAPARASQFALAQEALGICTWIWDVERDKIEWFGDLSPLLGLPPHSFGGRFDEYLEHLHPEDRARARATATRSAS
jgi:PAS domain-containing protein